jgi:hypothetical protein
MDHAGRPGLTTGGAVNRRDFMKASGTSALGLSIAHPPAPRSPDGERSVILLLLVGGPSQLETFDPKPDAPSEVRGPFGSIATSVPGVRVNEYLPGIARRMDRLAIVRSLYHDAAPIHETGLQLLQTGRLCRLGQEQPHFGSVVARTFGPRNGTPPFVMLPGPIGNTGVGVSHGDTPGDLGPEFRRCAPSGVLGHGDSDEVDGLNPIGRSCLLACRLVEAGARVVTVNMFRTVFNEPSWDCHGAAPFSTLDDYRRELLPRFDAAYSALVDDLERTGRLDSTLVVATGEFGRAPRLNAAGGRDHWPGVWSALLTGGGIRGGQVIGASDAQAAAPADRPVSPAELLATIYQSLGLDPSLSLPDGRALADAKPIGEAFT